MQMDQFSTDIATILACGNESRSSTPCMLYEDSGKRLSQKSGSLGQAGTALGGSLEASRGWTNPAVMGIVLETYGLRMTHIDCVLLVQMLGGLGQGGPPLGAGQRSTAGQGNMRSSSAGGDVFAALGELPPDQAALWRQRIL